MNGVAWAGLMTAYSQVPTAYVLGNHEYYGQSKLELIEETQKHSHTNVFILNPGVLEFEDTVVIGCTLHSALDLPGYTHYPPVAYSAAIGDFYVTRDWSPEMHIAAHKAEVEFLDTELEKHKDKKRIVVSHFVPTMQCIAPFWEGSSLNPYFTSDLDWLMDKHEPDLWVFGHTHDKHDVLHTNGKTRLVCNPRGYPKERKTKFKWKEIDL